MKQILLLFSILILISCQSEQSKSNMGSKVTDQSLNNFKSSDQEISRAIDLITRKLTAKEVDSFYVSEIDKSQDSIDIILFHYDLMKKLKEHKNHDNPWIVLPPITAMPDWTKHYTYSIKDDHLIEDSAK